jgi:anti-sigma regulatory factor (Ser/Thr protein kinase)
MILVLSIHAPRQVRDSLELQYAGSMERSLLDDVRLLTSEVVSNAVQHSGRPTGDPLTLETSVVHDVLRVEVTDGGKGALQLTPRTSNPPSGLGLVQMLSDRWSSHQNDTFHVWFEIDVTSSTPLSRKSATPHHSVPPQV